MFNVPCELLKQSFLDFNQVAFWDGQEAENEFKVTCEALKHRLNEFTQVAFWAGQEEENEFPVLGDHLKHPFFRPNQKRIFDF